MTPASKTGGRSPGVRQAAAPLNTEPRWPEGYIRALREAGTQEKTIPYCLDISSPLP
jgi:hypothetical protein